MKKFYSQRFIVSVALCCIYLIAWAQAPDGYYDGEVGVVDEPIMQTLLF